jgi:hypothetical protein
MVSKRFETMLDNGSVGTLESLTRAELPPRCRLRT